MSRVGKEPIPIPSGAKVEIKGDQVTVTGPKGTLQRTIHSEMTAQVVDGVLTVTRPSDQKTHRALHGLTRALLNNMVQGVTEGYSRELQIIGVGYKAVMQGKTLIMNLGHSHPIVVSPPDGITIETFPKENKLIISGIDKELVGQMAANIRSFRKPEPYKGKGVRYAGEHVRSKAGKTAGA